MKHSRWAIRKQAKERYRVLNSETEQAQMSVMNVSELDVAQVVSQIVLEVGSENLHYRFIEVEVTILSICR